jgi:hypothetical protein
LDLTERTQVFNKIKVFVGHVASGAKVVAT